jgi:hypothetical protein
MTGTHQFAKRGGNEELWNVTLLPLPAARRERPEAKPLENVAERRSVTGDDQIVSLPTSFESQLQASGW